MPNRVSDWTHARARALLLGKRIKVRALQHTDRRAETPLAVPAGADGVAVLFPYGAVVLFNVPRTEEPAFLASLAGVVEDPHERPENEEAELRVDGQHGDHVDPAGVIRLSAVNEDRLLVVADVLAKSVILAYYEDRLAGVFDHIEPIAEQLRRSGRGAATVHRLLDHIGDVLITQHRMVGRVEVTEKPDILWDRPELERLYLRLQDEYELPDRDRALNRKLELISQTATTSLGLLESRRSLRVEWYIVILIVVEIAIYLYDLVFLKGGH